MIKHIPYDTLGKANHGWLQARHHFSFAHYYNPERLGFGTIRVINDDWIAPGAGFPPHPHRDMEIISFVRTGAITHQDNMGNKGITPAGEVQVMSAGTGVTHSEYNTSTDPLTLYQIWITPNKRGVTPRWESKQFPVTQNDATLPLLVSGYAEDSEALFIHQKARIFGGVINAGKQVELPITHQAYALSSRGKVKVIADGYEVAMQKGDGAEVTQAQTLSIYAEQDSEVILIDAPTH